MNRKLCTTILMLPELKKPAVIDPFLVSKKDITFKDGKKHNFDE